MKKALQTKIEQKRLIKEAKHRGNVFSKAKREQKRLIEKAS